MVSCATSGALRRAALPSSPARTPLPHAARQQHACCSPHCNPAPQCPPLLFQEDAPCASGSSAACAAATSKSGGTATSCVQDGGGRSPAAFFAAAAAVPGPAACCCCKLVNGQVSRAEGHMICVLTEAPPGMPSGLAGRRAHCMHLLLHTTVCTMGNTAAERSVCGHATAASKCEIHPPPHLQAALLLLQSLSSCRRGSKALWRAIQRRRRHGCSFSC